MDYEIPFWKEWLESDCLKRQRMVEKLPVLSEFIDICKEKKVSNKHKKHIIGMLINGFFEDLESAIYTKNEKENT